MIEEEIYFVSKKFFGDEEEHCFDVECQDGIGTLIGTDIKVVYPKRAKVLANDEMAEEVLEYRGLYDLGKEEITYGDIMVCYGKLKKG